MLRSKPILTIQAVRVAAIYVDLVGALSDVLRRHDHELWRKRAIDHNNHLLRHSRQTIACRIPLKPRVQMGTSDDQVAGILWSFLTMPHRQRSDGRLLKAAAAFLAVSASLAVAQTRITPPKNKYTPAQDVELGRQAAKEVEQQLPLLRDDGIESFVDRIGRRLVQVMPPEMEHREFRYSFKVINVREINAFALPGGPMYVNRGMIQAAAVEGEVAGVMAHELSHVILRHGTAGASKQQPFQIGALAGAIAGAIIGGDLGQVVAQGTQFGLGTYFLRYSREYRSRPTCSAFS